MVMLYEKPLKIELLGLKLLINEKEHPSSVRTLSEMNDVLMKEVDINQHGNIEMYYMFRDVYKTNGMRYDITVIPDRKIGGECTKTYGHCHPFAEGKLTYPEVYQVLSGRAVFILQKELRNGANVVTIVDAKKGDVVLIPPSYCHVSINPGNEKLILANIVADRFDSDYELFKANRGDAYYYTDDGALVQNSNYVVEKNERIEPAELNGRYGFKSRDLLVEFYEDSEKFEFLKKPSLIV